MDEETIETIETIEGMINEIQNPVTTASEMLFREQVSRRALNEYQQQSVQNLEGTLLTGNDGVFPYGRSAQIPEFPMPFEPLQITGVPMEKGTLLKKLYAEYKDYARFTRMPEELGSRERTYLENKREANKQKRSIHEWCNLEVAVPVSYIPGTIWESIKSQGYVSGVRRDQKNNVVLVCSSCNKQLVDSDSFVLFACLYCAECTPRNLEVCDMCSKPKMKCKKVKQYDGTDSLICEGCRKRIWECRNCGHPLESSFLENRQCEACIETNSTQYGRRFSYSMKWVSNALGEIIKSTRLFSSEIEAGTSSARKLSLIAEGIPTQCGIGSDGSLSGISQCFEIQTPRLGGQLGEELVRRVCGTLKAQGTVVNDTCGMHVHLDGKDLFPESRKTFPTAIIQLWKAHIVFEDIILSFIPYNRRNNDFCRPMRDVVSTSEIDACNSLFEIEQLWYKEVSYDEIRNSKGHHYHSSRYFGVNLHSLLANKHLEIRYHSGTVNPRKILEWANLHCLIMDAAAKGVFSHAFLREAQTTSDVKEKTLMLFTAIGLAESSRQYFRSRQKKFSDKKLIDNEN